MRKHSNETSIMTFIILMVFVVTAVGSAYLTYRFFGGVQADPKIRGPRYDAGEFTVDLLPEVGVSSRMIKVSISAQTASHPAARALRKLDVEIRDAVIRILRNRTPSSITGKAGMEMLAADIKSTINDVLGSPGVTQVYFTELVMP